MSETVIKAQIWDDPKDSEESMDRPDRPRSGGLSDDRKPKTCRVCGDRALSVNFNVVTCESCKAFFRRNALKPKAFRCPFSGVCEINVVSRKFCKKCRLRKCFEVGMMKEWIMSDEARLKKRELINLNRDKRRTVIMATAAKHGLDGDVEKDIDDVILDGSKSHFAPEDGYFAPEKSNDSNEFPSHDKMLISIPKLALIEFATLCRTSYKDLSLLIEDFLDRYSISGTKRKSIGDELLQQPSIVRHQNQPKGSTLCDCGICTDYRIKIPNLNTNRIPQPTAPQVQIPTMTKILDDPVTGNMLSFLAPSFGKQFQTIDYPLSSGNQNIVNLPRPPVANTITSSPWIDSIKSMPTIPLDIPPHVYDMVNLPLQRPPTLSCPLPIKLMTQQQSPNYDEEIIKMAANSKIQNKAPVRPIVDGVQKLTKMPYTMLPRLQELIEAKKLLLITETRKGSTDEKTANGPKQLEVSKTFLKHIIVFDRILESDQMELLNANQIELEILRQVMFYDIFKLDSSYKISDLSAKYLRIIPKLWRRDDCIMAILMAVAGFNSDGCELVCRTIVDEQRKFYTDMLKKYLECIYKSSEVDAAHSALLDILYDMRYEKAGMPDLVVQ